MDRIKEYIGENIYKNKRIEEKYVQNVYIFGKIW